MSLSNSPQSHRNSWNHISAGNTKVCCCEWKKSLMACFESVCLGQWLSWKAWSQSVMMSKLHACLNKSWSQNSDFYFCFPPRLNKNVASYLLSVSRPLHNVWDKDTFFVSVCHHNRLQVKQQTTDWILNKKPNSYLKFVLSIYLSIYSHVTLFL